MSSFDYVVMHVENSDGDAVWEAKNLPHEIRKGRQVTEDIDAAQKYCTKLNDKYNGEKFQVFALVPR